MAWEKPLWHQSFPAGADLSDAANQFKFVELGADGRVTVCNAATDKPVGVLQSLGAENEQVVVMMMGVSKVQADGAIANINTPIGTSADGQAAAKTVGTDTTHYVVGFNMEAAGAAGNLIACYIDCMNPHRAA